MSQVTHYVRLITKVPAGGGGGKTYAYTQPKRMKALSTRIN